MSQMTVARAIARPARTARPSAAPRQRPRLRVVDAAPAIQSHTGFVVLCIALVLGGLLAGLLLNTARAESSFNLSDLNKQQTRLHDTKVTLAAELSAKESPEALAVEAERLGLVPSPSTAVLRLSDHTVLGVAASVDPTDSFTVVTPFVTASEGDLERIQEGLEGGVQGG